jgi:large subunit ribosomal protein L3
MSGLLAKKRGMTQIFAKSGDLSPVTVVDAEGCRVVQRKTTENDGYDAIQVCLDEVREKLANKPQKGHFAKAKVPAARFLREFRVKADDKQKAGDELKSSIFKAGDFISVSGVSKGKGFQGVMKRHGKAGGPASHGSRFHRTTGSIGQRTSPGEVFKNMKMPGHMGSENITVKNVEVVEVRDNLIFLKGPVPGANNGLVILRKV